MTITGQSSLAKDEIDRMVRDAEANAAEDRRRRDEVEVRNNGETLLYQTEKVLREQGGKLPDEERATVEGKRGRSQDRTRWFRPRGDQVGAPRR